MGNPRVVDLVTVLMKKWKGLGIEYTSRKLGSEERQKVPLQVTLSRIIQSLWSLITLIMRTLNQSFCTYLHGSVQQAVSLWNDVISSNLLLHQASSHVSIFHCWGYTTCVLTISADKDPLSHQSIGHT